MIGYITEYVSYHKTARNSSRMHCHQRLHRQIKLELHQCFEAVLPIDDDKCGKKTDFNKNLNWTFFRRNMICWLDGRREILRSGIKWQEKHVRYCLGLFFFYSFYGLWDFIRSTVWLLYEQYSSMNHDKEIHVNVDVTKWQGENETDHNQAESEIRTTRENHIEQCVQYQETKDWSSKEDVFVKLSKIEVPRDVRNSKGP